MPGQRAQIGGAIGQARAGHSGVSRLIAGHHSASAMKFFKLPTDRVIELGSQDLTWGG